MTTRFSPPPPFSDWIAGLTEHWPLLDDPRRAFEQYARTCADVLRRATGRNKLADLPWRFPTLSVPLDWLDELPPAESLVAAKKESGEFLRTEYERLVPAHVRRRLGEYYTPAWLADRVVERLLHDAPGDAHWLDPYVGAGAFFHSLARRGVPMANVVGLDANPWAVLAAAANGALAAVAQLGRTVEDYLAPVGWLDPLRGEPPVELNNWAERLVGNPPWQVWDRLPLDARTAAAPLWRRYGLFTERGMAAILGGGKKELAALATLRSIDLFLKPGGRLGFVAPKSLFTAGGAGRGFRRWLLPNGEPLRVDGVEDLAGLQPFAGAVVHAVLVWLTRGRSTTYPVRYFLLKTKIDHVASPSEDDPLSSWRHHSADRSAALDMVLGPCAYRSHLGVNTGGANGVYWFAKQAELGGGLWRMTNLAGCGRKTVAKVEVDLEAELLFPLLRGNDVRQWIASPSAWILFVQDVLLRRGFDEEELRRRAPHALKYLQEFEPMLQARAAYTRYFGPSPRKPLGAPFYSMFDVGAYTVAPYKVVWNRMGSKLAAAVVSDVEGRPILPQETHAAFAVDCEDEGFYLTALLNSPWAAEAMQAMGQVGGKSFATPRTIHRLRLKKFDSCEPLHIVLAGAARQASLEAAEGELRPATLKSIADHSAEYWEIAVKRQT